MIAVSLQIYDLELEVSDLSHPFLFLIALDSIEDVSMVHCRKFSLPQVIHLFYSAPD